MGGHGTPSIRPRPSPLGKSVEVLGPLRRPSQKRRRRQETPPSRSDDSDDEGHWTEIVSDQRIPRSTPCRSLACPYYKYDPIRYHQCAQLILSKMSYVKQHLTRKHAPCIHCYRCYQVFDAKQDLIEHLRRQPPCAVLSPRTLPGMSETQLMMLKNRSNPAKNEAGQWEEIWNLLFPDKPPPASAYIELDIPHEINELLEYMAQYIPPKIVSRFPMRSATGPTTSAEDMSRQVMDVVMEVADQWIGQRRENGPSSDRDFRAP